MTISDAPDLAVTPPRSKAEQARGHIYPIIVENMRDGVLAFNGRGKIIAVNSPARSILGLEDDDWVGKSFAEEVISRPELADVSEAIVDAMYAPNNVLTREVTVGQAPDERYLVIRTSMLRDDQRGETKGVVAIISDISDQIRALRERIEFGHILVLFIATMAMANIITLVVDRYLDVNVYSPAFAWTYLIMIAVPVIGSLVSRGRSASSVGLTLTNWRRATVEGLLVSVALIAMLAALVYFSNPDAIGKRLSDTLQPSYIAIILLLYAPHSFLQEVLARGVLQNSLRRVLNDRRGIISVGIASLVFGLFHSHFGLAAIAVTMISGLIFGGLFNRHGNLIGATIVHVLAGAATFALGIV